MAFSPPYRARGTILDAEAPARSKVCRNVCGIDAPPHLAASANDSFGGSETRTAGTRGRTPQ